MSIDIVLLVMRVLIALALYAFLGGLFYYMWRDLQLAGEQAVSHRQPAGRLVVIESDAEIDIAPDSIYPLQSPTTIGRGPTNTIILPDSSASATHARIVRQHNQWWLSDKESRNGTSLNDQPVNEPVVLTSDDVIGVGRVKFRVEFDK